jgi:ElaB/YqjD/DUF883 family membrane-anchored ribosome-binding protein
MTVSVEQLRRESEQSRAELAATVDRLRERITDTVEDIRQKSSPQHIKSELSGYVSQKTRSWVEALRQQATENPMQAIAAGTAVGVPLLRLARSFPLPLLMIGAGLALTSKTVRDRAAEATAPAIDTAREFLGDAAERAQALRANLEDGLSSAQGHASGLASDAQDQLTGIAEDARSRAAQATSGVADKIRSGLDAAKEAAAATKDAATAAPATARQIVGENPAVIGGLGLAIGAIIAAALPGTKAEAKVMGQASDGVKQAAGEAAKTGIDTFKDATISAAQAAAKSVSDSDLGEHASRMMQSTAEKLKGAAEDIATSALSPSQNPHT